MALSKNKRVVISRRPAQPPAFLLVNTDRVVFRPNPTVPVPGTCTVRVPVHRAIKLLVRLFVSCTSTQHNPCIGIVVVVSRLISGINTHNQT